MAYDYNRAKKLYEWLNDEQKQQFANDNSWQVQDFLKQYNAEMNNNQQSNNNSSNFNNGNGTNWQNQTQTPTNPISQQPVDMTAEEYRNSDEEEINKFHDQTGISFTRLLNGAIKEFIEENNL